MPSKINKERYSLTDTLHELVKSEQLNEDDLEQTAQHLLTSIDVFTSLRKERPAKAGEVILFNIDRAVREHKARPHTDGDKITCTEGCAHCCMIPVAVTIPEMVLALDYADEHGIQLDEEKLKRQARYDKALWFEQPREDLACVFLTDQKRCAVYPVRPASCQKHFSLGDPAECDTEKNLGGNMKRWVVLLAEVLYSAIMNIFRPGPLPKVLLIALRNRQKGGTA